MRRIGAGIVLVVILAGVGSYLYFKKVPFSEPIPQGSLGETSAFVVPDNFREYRNSSYNFSLHYPEDLSVKEYDEGNGARTIVFSDRANEYTFQIFITPYTESTVTPERFRLDVPSGVFQEPFTVLVDGAPATAFFSSNGLMGETREVWIIHGGYLYEVTTFKDLDTWLSKIMTTWRFAS